MNLIWIETQAEFEQAMQAINACQAVGLDTEFYRRQNFFSKPCLLQVSTTDTIYLIDLLIDWQLDSFTEIWQNPNIVKIFHASTEDIELLYKLTKAKPYALFDTQIAALFLNIGKQIGYAALAQTVNPSWHIDKSLSMFDWSMRPLPESCKEYAAIDVLYLADIYQTLVTKLKKADLLERAKADMAMLVDKAIDTVNGSFADLYYLHSNICFAMSAEQQLVLAKILQWREQRARLINRIRKNILTNEQAIELAYVANQITEEATIQKIMYPSQYKYHGQDLWRLCTSIDQANIAPDFIRILPAKRNKNLFTAIKKELATVATKLCLEPTLLASKKQVMDLLYYASYTHNERQNMAIPDILKNWRKEQIGNRLLEIYYSFAKEPHEKIH